MQDCSKHVAFFFLIFRARTLALSGERRFPEFSIQEKNQNFLKIIGLMEETVEEYQSWEYKKEIVVPVLNLEKEKIPKEKGVFLLILCGLPGSGKSTLSHSLETYGWIRVNQDDLGSADECKKLLKKAMKHGKSVVVDRCNVHAKERKMWVNEVYIELLPHISGKRIHQVCRLRFLEYWCGRVQR